MAKASDNPFPSVLLVEQAAAPTTPGAGQARLYRGTDNKLHIVDDAGVASEVGGASAAVPTVTVRRSANLALTAGATTAVPYDVEVEDTDGFHDNTTNPSRLTVPAGLGGLYLIRVSSEFAGPSSSDRTIHLRKNGLGSFLEIDTRQDAVGTVRPKAVTVERLAAGDYVEAIAYAAAAGTTFDHAWGNAPSLGYPTFSMTRLGN